MMKKILRNNRGITLISLGITIIVLIIITNVLILNVRENLNVKKLYNLENDIQILRSRVLDYYSDYGTFPINKEWKYENDAKIQEMKNADVVSEAVDIGDFYVLDLAAMENLTLSYGKDYEKYKNGESVVDAKDIYIINETSGNVFYANGITVDNETFYTDYRKGDTVPVDIIND